MRIDPLALRMVSAIWSYTLATPCPKCGEPDIRRILTECQRTLEGVPLDELNRDFVQTFFAFFRRLLSRGVAWTYEMVLYEASHDPRLLRYKNLLLEICDLEPAPYNAPFWANELRKQRLEVTHANDSR